MLNAKKGKASAAGSEGVEVTGFCLHCGRRVPSKFRTRKFCCDGCERVHQVIQDEGLSDFYSRDSVRAPVGDRPLREANYDWAKPLQARAESAEKDEAEIELGLSGMSCGGCVWLVERLGRRQPGMLDVRASLLGQGMTLRWRKGRLDLPAFLAELHRFGYDGRRPAVRGLRWDALTGRAVLCLLFAANLALLTAVRRVVPIDSEGSVLWELLTLVFLLLTAIVGVGYFLRGAFREIAARRVPVDVGLLFGLCGWGVAGLAALFGIVPRPWAATGFALAAAAALLTRRVQLALLRPLARRGERNWRWSFLGPVWMVPVFALGANWAGFQAGGGLSTIEAVAACGLVLAPFPLAAARELGISSAWVMVAVLLSLSGVVLVGMGILGLAGVLFWHGIAGILPCFGMASAAAEPNVEG